MRLSSHARCNISFELYQIEKYRAWYLARTPIVGIPSRAFSSPRVKLGRLLGILQNLSFPEIRVDFYTLLSVTTGTCCCPRLVIQKGSNRESCWFGTYRIYSCHKLCI